MHSAAKTGLPALMQGNWLLPGMDAILEALLFGKALIPFLEMYVGDIGIDLFVLVQDQTVVRMIVAVSSEVFFLKIGLIFADITKVLFAPATMGARF